MAKKQEPKSPQLVNCASCLNSYLMQRDNNPIIAECNGKRYVANTIRKCENFLLAKRKKQINPMKPINIYD